MPGPTENAPNVAHVDTSIVGFKDFLERNLCKVRLMTGGVDSPFSVMFVHHAWLYGECTLYHLLKFHRY